MLDDFIKLLYVNKYMQLAITYGVILFITFLFLYLKNLILNRLKNFANKKNYNFTQIFAQNFSRPCSWLIWLICCSYLINTSYFILLWQKNDLYFISIARILGSIIIIGWVAISCLIDYEKYHISSKNITTYNRPTVTLMYRLARIFIIVSVIIAIMQTLNFSISGILALGGFGSIIIGFAAKELLANFFGGLMLYLDRPFSEGDWVKSTEREKLEGIIENIGWRSTRIRLFTKVPVYVPNALFNTMSICNMSRMTNRRIKEIIGLRYNDAGKLDKIISQIEGYLQDNTDIDHTATTVVVFHSFGAYSVNFMIYTFTKTTDWKSYLRIKEEVFFKIIQIIKDNDADFAFPTQTIHFNKDQYEQMH